MKHNMRTWSGLLLVLALMGALVGCDLAAGGGVTKQDAQVYVQGELDAAYRGIYNNDYIDLVEDYTEVDAEKLYEENVAAESEIMMDFLWMEEITDAQAARGRELVRAIYAFSKYEVMPAEKLSNGNYSIPVKVYPIDILQQISDEDLNEIWYSVTDGVDDAKVEKMSDEEYDALMVELNVIYNDKVLDHLESLIPSIGYGKVQSILLQLNLGDDDMYTLSDTDWRNLDAMIIDYYGSYQ